MTTLDAAAGERNRERGQGGSEPLHHRLYRQLHEKNKQTNNATTVTISCIFYIYTMQYLVVPIGGSKDLLLNQIWFEN